MDSAGRFTTLEPGSSFAGYRIEGIVARGGMGVVYRATDPELDRTVALKIIAPEHTQNPDAVTRFKSEARLAASLEHPNIVPIHRGGEYQSVLYLAMRFVPGTNLRHLVDAGPLEMGQVVLVTRSVASALDAAHERGLVHRDVKPANILISGEGDRRHVYLTDFGLTKRLGSAGSLTRTGAWVGTPDYVAPEQIQSAPVDGRADIYSLGCVLYEMLTGSVAYPKDNDMAKLWAHVTDPPPSPSLTRPELNRAFDDIVARATAKDPRQRYATASELAADVINTIEDRQSFVSPDDVQLTQPGGQPSALPASAPPPPPPSEHDLFISEPVEPAAASAQPPAGPPPAAPPQPLSFGGGPPAPPERKPRNPRALLAVAAAVVVALAVVAFVVLGGGGDDDGGTEAAAPVVATKLPADLAWQPITSPPFQRQYAAATGVGNKLWVIGGIGRTSSSTTTKVYNTSTRTWATGPGLPLPLHHHAAVTYKGEAVVIGGFIPGAELTSGQSDRVFALRGGAWVPLPKLNHARAAAGAAVVGDKIVVFGGQADGKLVPQTEVFDGERWTDVAELPTPREHLGGASDGRYAYAVGGRALSADQNTGTLERYDPESDTWTKLDSMPEAAGSVGATYAAGRVFAIGGESTTSVSDSVQAYDIPNGRWSKLPSLPTARHGVAAATLDGAVYAIGGATEPGHVGSTKEADVLKLSGGPAQTTAGLSWRTVADAPEPTQYAGSTEVGGRVWLMGGISTGEKATTETAAYDRAINTWTAGPKLPQALHHVMAVTYQGDPVVIGGFVPGAELTSKQSDRVYVLHDDQWEPLPPLNRARAAAAAAVVGNKIVVVGGQADGKLVRETEVFDGQRWTIAADIPTPREHLGAASDGKYLYAVGGRNLSADKNSAALERYDPASDSWTKLKNMPKTTGSVGAAFVAGSVVAVGGESSTSPLDAVQAYEVRQRAWSQLPALPAARHGLAVTALKNSLYAIGGAAVAGHAQSTKKTYVLDFE